VRFLCRDAALGRAVAATAAPVHASAAGAGASEPGAGGDELFWYGQTVLPSKGTQYLSACAHLARYLPAWVHL